MSKYVRALESIVRREGDCSGVLRCEDCPFHNDTGEFIGGTTVEISCAVYHHPSIEIVQICNHLLTLLFLYPDINLREEALKVAGDTNGQ